MVIDYMSCDLPWRIHWRLSGADPGPFLDVIHQARPLSLLLEVIDPDEVVALGLPWENTSVVVVLEEWKTAPAPFFMKGISRWEFPVPGLEGAKPASGMIPETLPPAGLALRWIPGRASLKELPGILEFVHTAGLGLTLPNRPADDITARKGDDLPDFGAFGPDELHCMRKLADALGNRRLRVHDFVLSTLLGIEGPEPQGCGAADSTVFVDGSGMVFPCDSLAVRMGSLAEETIEDIWNSPIRRRIRRDIAATPSVCRTCDDLPRCLGGCRGAAFHTFGHFGAPDPGCRKE
ncbi:MAG TPA: SPASM domain-containing protein [Proteobacteria bacterium]|nr:pyrroloquinoline quinone biosynthesis protein PqqE [bacterium BMS3Abin14]HDL53671.1 SPASM domain-containing protein [Pseudomonadota bacterium]